MELGFMFSGFMFSGFRSHAHPVRIYIFPLFYIPTVARSMKGPSCLVIS